MKWLNFFVFPLFVFVFYGAFLFQYDLKIIPQELVSSHPTGFYDYKGVLNVHTLISTGSGSHEEVIRAAQKAGLDFVSFSDLNVFETPENLESYHDNVLVFIDGEYSYLNSRLLNLFATSREHLQGIGRSQVFFNDLLNTHPKQKESGILLLAHPFKSDYMWSGDYPVGLDGIELINLKQIWQKAWLSKKASFFWSLLIYPFNDRLAFIRLVEDLKEEMNLLDNLSQKRHTIGISGSDAEAKFLFGENPFFRFPAYETLFGISTNHVLLKAELTGNEKSDREKISQAISQGNFYVSFDLLANPKGFNAVLKDSGGKSYLMGSELKWTPGMELEVTLPHKPQVPFDVDVYKNGELMVVSNSQRTVFKLPGPGVYRVRVRVIPTFPLPDGKRWVPWIYTNGFFLRDGNSDN